MGYYVQIDQDEMEQIGSNSGYGDLIRWVQKLPHAEAPNLRHLIRYGWEDHVSLVHDQLKDAIQNHAPKGYVLETAQGFEKIVGKRRNAIVITITDGMGPDDGTDDDDVGDEE